jgi:hypothetical protein
MFDTFLSQIGFAVAFLVACFAFLKGDEPERVGAGAYMLGMMSSQIVHDGTRLYDFNAGLMAIDGVFLAVCAGLAWKSRRSWPVWACAFTALMLMSHILILVDRRPPVAVFYAVYNLASYGILAAIAMGTLLAWRDRRLPG